MPSRLHLVRHAQGLHNVSAVNHSIVDPALTAYGRRQCATLAAAFPVPVEKIALVAASPLRRTLDTARLSFPGWVAAGNAIQAVPDAQEVGTFPCDHGRARSILEGEYAATEIDLSLVHDGWENKKGRYSGDPRLLEERALALRRWLREQVVACEGQGDVVLVTHGGFLHFLTQDWSDYNRFSGTGWTNTEYRTYEFLDADSPEAAMTETDESRSRRASKARPNRASFIKLQKQKLEQQQRAVKSNVRVLSEVAADGVVDSRSVMDQQRSKI